MDLYVLQLVILISITILIVDCSQEKPFIVEHPSNAYGLSLQRVNLRCSASGTPTPKIVWYKDGRIVESYFEKPVTSNRIVKPDELLFLHLDTQDEGVYYCNASNINGWTVSNNASVMIAYLNKDISGPEAKTASVGETVLMECKPPKGVPKPYVTWKFNNNDITMDKRIKVLDTGDLRIDKASRRDSGRYSCVAKNFAYQRESNAAMLTVRQKPYFKVAPQHAEVKVNDDAEFTCIVQGDPRPTIVWRRENQKIPSSRAVLLQNKGLRINKVQLSDMGTYICQASNSAGTIEADAKLTVISVPGFLETPENQNVRVGDTVKFNCRITGSPMPTVTWVHNGDYFIVDEDIGRRSDRVRVNKDGSIIISPVKLSDSGKYECKATSYTGKIQSSALLTVIDSQQFAPPVIDIGPQNQTLKVGLTATFFCKPKDQDDLSIIWLKNDQLLELSSDPRIIQLSTVLKINQVRMNDAGNYTCKVVRKDAYTVWTVSLKILGKSDSESPILQTTDDKVIPSAPTNFEVVERGDSWISFKWDLPNSDSSENGIIHYLVEFSRYESRKGWYMQSVFYNTPGRISNLSPNTGYRFLIRSVNELATGRPNVVPFVVFTNKKQHYSALNYNQLKSKMENVFCENLRLKSVSTDQMTIFWHVGGPQTALRILSGFVAKYKQVPLSRCLANRGNSVNMEHCSLEDNMLNQIETEINNPKSIFNEEGQENAKLVPMTDWNDNVVAYTIITSLKPFVCYEVYVKPYLDHPKYGRLTGTHSKAITILTYDSVPTQAPSDLTARWLTNTSVEISWKAAPSRYINGILKGYSLHLIGNDTNSTRSIEVSPKSTSVRVLDLVPNMPYSVHIAASTCQGEGIRSAGLVLTASSSIITMSPFIEDRSGVAVKKNAQVSVAKQPWFISIMAVGGCLWVMICAFIIVVCRGMYLRGLIYKSGYSNGTKLISNSNPQLPAVSSNGRISNQVMSQVGGNGNSNGALYKDTIILQPLIGSTNSGSVNESKVDPCENVTTSTTLNTTIVPNTNNSNNNSQRRFQDSVSSNSSTCKSSVNQPVDKQKQRMMAISANNVAPYATASLLQQCIGISTKNSLNNCNYPLNNSSSHRNIIIPFSDPIMNVTNPDLTFQNNLLDWAINSSGHLIPPPPEFPPPPAPVSPTASNSTYYLQQDDGSYASCPIDVPISSASTMISPIPGYLWSAKHNNLVPIPGYIDYSCTPYNMGARQSDTGSIASSFALPPPHDMLSMTQFSDDPYTPPSTAIGNTQISQTGLSTDVVSCMTSSHLSNGSNPTGGNSNGSGKDYSKRDSASRSGGHDDSSPLEEEDESDNDEEDECHTTDYRTSVHSDSMHSWQNSTSNPLLSQGSSFFQYNSPYFAQLEEANVYDICSEDQSAIDSTDCPPQIYKQQTSYFPPPPNNYFQIQTTYPDGQITHCYDNPPAGQLNSTNINPFLGFLGETPIV